jgi:hypothetical protein
VDLAIWHRSEADETLLKKLIEDHHRWTGSLRARDILDNWAKPRARFVKVFPHEYKRALGEMNAATEGRSRPGHRQGDGRRRWQEGWQEGRDQVSRHCIAERVAARPPPAHPTAGESTHHGQGHRFLEYERWRKATSPSSRD